jgi:hypothetical protein
MYEKFIASYKAARKAGAPLVAVQTPDQQASCDRLIEASKAEWPQWGYDRVRGLRPLNTAAEAAEGEVLDGAEANATRDPTGVLAEFAPRLTTDTVLHYFGARRYLSEPGVDGATWVQAVWNLRDVYKGNGCTLILYAPDISVPPELKDDVLVLDEPLPGDAELATTLTALLATNGVVCDEAKRQKAVDAVRGLATFAAEQAVAMSVTGSGKAKELDLDEVWSRKRAMISNTPGLSIWQGGETLADVIGCDAITDAITRKAKGKRPFRAVFWFDEVEKMFAGATAGTADSSGVSQGFMGAMLTKTQEWNDKGSSGMLAVGGPGTGKSLIAKAAGATFGVPTIAVDTGSMKASFVGESEARLRAAFNVMDVVAGGQALLIMTCNQQIALPPEMKRRLTGGIWYFDLPDKAAQAALWRYYMTKLALAEQPLPECAGWTGAEIKQACTLAWEWEVPLTETAKFIVPVAKSAKEQIERLREQADQCWLSASTPGVYRKPSSIAERVTRKIAQEA